MDDDLMHDAVDGTVRVEFSFCGLSGHRELETRSLLVPTGTTVDGLLESLSTLLGSDVRHDTATGGARFLVINGTYCVMPRDLGRELADGDAVALLPFVAGG